MQDQAVLDAIKAAHAQEMKGFEIKAWAQWGTPEQKHILTLPVSLPPTLSPDLIFDRARSSARAEILKCGYSPAEAEQATLTFEAVQV